MSDSQMSYGTFARSTNVESYIDDRINTHSLLGGASRRDEACIGLRHACRKLNHAETRYYTIEHECLATVWATKRFHPYLYGREFIIETVIIAKQS